MAENLTQTQNTGNTFMALKSIIRKNHPESKRWKFDMNSKTNKYKDNV